jgi:hypothetical protein
MSRVMVWLLAGAMLTPPACAPRAGRREAAEEKAADPARYLAKLKAYYAGIPEAVDDMLPRIHAHAQALAALGPRQTGQEGCDRAFEYIRQALREAYPPDRGGNQKTFSSTVTVALDRKRRSELDLIRQNGSKEAREFSHVSVAGLGAEAQAWPAYAFAPNCVQPCATHAAEECPYDKRGEAGPFCRQCQVPRRAVDLGRGTWQDFRDNDLADAVVLLDFNSGDAWLRAASLGAVGALFIEPQRTTVFQADKKYLATLPLNFARLYLRRKNGLALRQALAKDPSGVRVTLVSRLEFTNVPARGLELTIPGKDRSYCFVLAGHFDARCIVPDLAYGGAEVWGIAELIELTRYLAENQPNCDVRIIFVCGHWQSQRVMRNYVSAGGPHFERIGRYYKLAMGIDLGQPHDRGILGRPEPGNVPMDRKPAVHRRRMARPDLRRPGLVAEGGGAVWRGQAVPQRNRRRRHGGPHGP